MPPSRDENGGKKKSGGRVSTRPYTDAYLVGLRIGLSCGELREVTYPALMWLIHQYNLMNEADGEDEKRDESRMATDADIRALMFM